MVDLGFRELYEIPDGLLDVGPEGLLDLPRLPIVVSVAGAEPRAQIRRWLVARHFREGAGFVCTA